METVVRSVGFSLPEREQEYELNICLGGTTEVLATRLIPAGTTSVTVELSGTGTMEFDLYIDGVFECSQPARFTDD